MSTVLITLDEATGKLNITGEAIHITKIGTVLVKDTESCVYEFKLQVLPKGQKEPTTAGVAFLTAPIQWTDLLTGKPISSPLECTVERKSDILMLLSVNQPQPHQGYVSYPFWILVSYQHVIYYHDPILLNEPDGGSACIKGKPPAIET